ncbi:MAG: YihY/virulence factor BrkB family protein [Actinomycetota bacterium]|nr:YihY/virulence factor BrkB family protein [Actinomycetota bacterium]
MSRLRRLIDGWQRRHASVAFAVAVGRKFVDDRAGAFAALIAYYAFFSIFPLLLALTSVLGFVLQGDEQLQEEIVDSVFAELPVVGPEIRESVGRIDGSGPALAIGLGLALWAGLGVTLALSRAFDRVWGVPRVRRRGYVAARARGLLLLVAIGVTLVVSSIATGIAIAGELGSRLESVLAVALSIAVDAIVMALVFLLGTSRRVRLAEVLPGVLLCTGGLLVLQTLGAVYVQATIQRASATYGLFAAVIGLLSWLLVTAQLLLIATEVNAVRADRLWPRSLGGTLTEADQRALERATALTQSDARQRIAVTFDEP